MTPRFPIIALAAGVLFAAPAFAQHSHGGHSGHDHGAAAAHDHSGHSHDAASFEAGEPGVAARVTKRIIVVAREGDGKMSFEPSRIVVRKGETVEFSVRNEGQLEHEFVLGSAKENAAHAAEMATMPDMKHDDPNAVRVAPGKSGRIVWRFNKAGSFEFACLIPGHYDAGMKGAAVVD